MEDELGGDTASQGHLVRGGAPLILLAHIVSSIGLADAALRGDLPRGIQRGDPCAQLFDPRDDGQSLLGGTGSSVGDRIHH